MVIVIAPRDSGQPIQSAIVMNRNSREIPVMISGITSGAVTMPASRRRPRKVPSRFRASPTSVPRMTASVALVAAMRRLSRAADQMSPSSSSDRYQRREKPPQSVTSRESLNE